MLKGTQLFPGRVSSPEAALLWSWRSDQGLARLARPQLSVPAAWRGLSPHFSLFVYGSCLASPTPPHAVVESQGPSPAVSGTGELRRWADRQRSGGDAGRKDSGAARPPGERTAPLSGRAADCSAPTRLTALSSRAGSPEGKGQIQFDWCLVAHVSSRNTPGGERTSSGQREMRHLGGFCLHIASVSQFLPRPVRCWRITQTPFGKKSSQLCSPGRPELRGACARTPYPQGRLARPSELQPGRWRPGATDGC